MIDLFSGNSLVIDVPVTDAEGEPFPLAGLTITYRAHPQFYPGDADTVVLTLGSGITITEAATARVSVPAGEIALVGQWLQSFTLVGGDIGTQTLWADTINVLPV